MLKIFQKKPKEKFPKGKEIQLKSLVENEDPIEKTF